MPWDMRSCNHRESARAYYCATILVFCHEWCGRVYRYDRGAYVFFWYNTIYYWVYFVTNTLFILYFYFFITHDSHHKRLSALSVPSPRSRGRTALFHNGVASEQIIQSSTTPSVVTGVELSLDSKFTSLLLYPSWNQISGEILFTDFVLLGNGECSY